jgi:hypothetical protein
MGDPHLRGNHSSFYSQNQHHSNRSGGEGYFTKIEKPPTPKILVLNQTEKGRRVFKDTFLLSVLLGLDDISAGPFSFSELFTIFVKNR